MEKGACENEKPDNSVAQTRPQTTRGNPELFKYEPVPGQKAVGQTTSRSCSRLTFLPILVLFLFLLYLPLYYPNNAFSKRSTTEVMVTGWEENRTRSLAVYVSPGHDTTLLQASRGCTPGPLTLLIVVCSAVENFRERAAIRSTWGSFPIANNLPQDYKVVFLLGHNGNATTQEIVVEESFLHQDIIQEDFVDTYNNLTLKSVMLLKQVVRFCPNVKYILKSDDDMFIHVPNLLNLVLHLSNLQVKDLLLGELICDAKPILDSTSKWYSPHYMFSGNVYPGYLSGTSYLMERNVAVRLYQAALVTPFFHLEDVYITGLCARKCDLRPRHHGGFSYLTRPPEPCLYVKTKYLISSHRITPEKLESFWSRLMKQDEKSCNSVTSSKLWARNNAARRLRLPLPDCRSK